MNLYVSNLGYHVQEEELRNLFTKFGEVISAKIIMNRETGKPRGFAFVEMKSSDEATNAMNSLNNKEIEGRALSISVARKREERSPRSNW